MNLGKTKAMVCTQGFVWGEQATASYKQRSTGEGKRPKIVIKSW